MAKLKTTCKVFIATSLDGFIAREDGDIDWLDAVPQSDPGEDYGYRELFDSVDALIMGRNTFEKVLSFAEWPYEDKPLVVLSKTLETLPPSLPESVRLMKDEPTRLLERLADDGMNSFYVDGGAVIQSFLRANLIDEMTISTIPTLIGSGIPLFGDLDEDVPLTLLSSQSYSNGIVISKYRISK